MTQTIEQLQAKVAELEEEKKELQALLDFDNARLDQIEDELEDVEYLGPFVEGIKVLKTQLAASQLRETQLREWIFANAGHSDTCNVIDIDENGLHCACSCGLTEALDLPRDTSALDAYVAKRLHDMACDKGLLRIQVEELTRQRDLAVDALEDVKGCFDAAEFEGLSDRIHEANVEYGSLADLVMRRLSPALSTVEHALSAIKESEAMAQGEKP